MDKTIKEFTGQVSGPSLCKGTHTVPAGARVSDNGGGSYWLEDFSFIEGSGDKHEAIHYGFIIPAEFVEQTA